MHTPSSATNEIGLCPKAFKNCNDPDCQLDHASLGNGL